jgi:hypothetical protein
MAGHRERQRRRPLDEEADDENGEAKEAVEQVSGISYSQLYRSPILLAATRERQQRQVAAAVRHPVLRAARAERQLRQARYPSTAETPPSSTARLSSFLPFRVFAPAPGAPLVAPAPPAPRASQSNAPPAAPLLRAPSSGRMSSRPTSGRNSRQQSEQHRYQAPLPGEVEPPVLSPRVQRELEEQIRAIRASVDALEEMVQRLSRPGGQA